MPFPSHFVSFVWNFMLKGEFRRVKPVTLMARPYQRVVVLHLVVIRGGGAAAALGSPLAAVAVLVAVKTMLDIALHARERASARCSPGARRRRRSSGGGR